jgi:O-antigen/teichoic acid export membrane protein
VNTIKTMLKGKLARNTGWMVLGQGLTFGMQALSFILLARLLGAHQYGVYVGAAAAVSMLAQYSSLGSGLVLIRHVSHNAERFSDYWGNLILVTMTLGLLITFLLYVFGSVLIGPAGGAIIVYVALSECTCARIAEGAGQAFQAFEQLKLTAMLTTLTNLARAITAAAMLLILHTATVKQWAIASLIVSIFSAGISLYLVASRLGKPKIDFSLIRDRAAEGFQFSFANSTASAYNDLDKAMLSHYGMITANGIYGTAYRVIDVVCAPIRSLQAAAFPRFCRLGREGLKGNAGLMFQVLRKTLPFSLGMGVLMLVCAPLVPRLLGKGFAESASALRWLALLPVMRSIHLSTGSALTGAGYQRFRTGSQVFAALLNFGLNLWLIPAYSWYGAAWSSLVTDGMLAVINAIMFAWILRRERTVSWRTEGLSC